MKKRKRLHDTPSAVAEMLARHSPQTMTRVLDPAVGEGALLQPIVKRLGQGTSVVCVDVDLTALDVARARLTSNDSEIHCVHGDFLRVTESKHLTRDNFDCVIMNPPYAAKKSEWTRMDCSAIGWHKKVSLPKEIAFVLRGIELLRAGGRLLAVVPTSIVSAVLFAEFRNRLGQIGRFHYVHELPKFTFPRVEGRIYLLVFEKGGCTSNIELRNHDLHEPECMRVGWSDLGVLRRLDFGFQQSRRRFKSLVDGTPELNWHSIDELFSICRGPRESPRGARIAIHTTDFRNGFWNVAARHVKCAPLSQVESEDLLVARVGRHCLQSLGAILGHRAVSWSDCVFRLRPACKLNVTARLLSIRAILRLPEIAYMLERGVGATYITESDLGALKIPSLKGRRFDHSINAYSAAMARKDCSRMLQIEKLTMKAILRLAARHSNK